MQAALVDHRQLALDRHGAAHQIVLAVRCVRLAHCPARILLAMLMIVRERRGEVGVLKAIGAKSSSIIKMFAVESLTLTLLASIIGIGIGILAAGPLTNSLANSSTSSQSQSSERGERSVGERSPGAFIQSGFDNVSTITAEVDWRIVLYALGSAMVIAIIGASTASLIVMRVRPAEAVRVE